MVQPPLGVAFEIFGFEVEQEAAEGKRFFLQVRRLHEFGPGAFPPVKAHHFQEIGPGAVIEHFFEDEAALSLVVEAGEVHVPERCF